MLYVLIAVTIVFGILRFVVPVTGAINNADVFKDLAHIWVGILIGIAAVVGGLRGTVRQSERDFPSGSVAQTRSVASQVSEIANSTWLFFALPILLTFLEVVAFIVRHK